MKKLLLLIASLFIYSQAHAFTPTIISTQTLQSGATFYVSSGTIVNPRLIGTTTNDNATTGNYGEYISSITTQANAINCVASGNTGDIINITLTAGDWDINADWGWIRNGATVVSADDLEFGVGTASGNNFTGVTLGDTGTEFTQSGANTMNIYQITMGRIRKSISTTTTFYLKEYCGTFGPGTPQMYGKISARRVR